MVVARGVDLKSGILLAERLRMMTERSPVTADGQTIARTISVGVATLECCGAERTVERLIGLADERLYRAKEGGGTASSVSDGQSGAVAREATEVAVRDVRDAAAVPDEVAAERVVRADGSDARPALIIERARRARARLQSRTRCGRTCRRRSPSSCRHRCCCFPSRSRFHRHRTRPRSIEPPLEEPPLDAPLPPPKHEAGGERLRRVRGRGARDARGRGSAGKSERAADRLRGRLDVEERAGLRPLVEAEDIHVGRRHRIDAGLSAAADRPGERRRAAHGRGVERHVGLRPHRARGDVVEREIELRLHAAPGVDRGVHRPGRTDHGEAGRVAEDGLIAEFWYSKPAVTDAVALPPTSTPRPPP